MDALNRNPEAQASGEHRRMALSKVQLRDDLSPRRKTAVRTSTTTMRLGWLARAAFVFEGFPWYKERPDVSQQVILFFHIFPTAIRPCYLPLRHFHPHNH
jgi:hypothetical protein